MRFPNGVEWQYEACPISEGIAFTAPEQSRGAYIQEVLNDKPAAGGPAESTPDCASHWRR